MLNLNKVLPLITVYLTLILAANWNFKPNVFMFSHILFFMAIIFSWSEVLEQWAAKSGLYEGHIFAPY